MVSHKHDAPIGKHKCDDKKEKRLCLKRFQLVVLNPDRGACDLIEACGGEGNRLKEKFCACQQIPS